MDKQKFWHLTAGQRWLVFNSLLQIPKGSESKFLIGEFRNQMQSVHKYYYMA